MLMHRDKLAFAIDDCFIVVKIYCHLTSLSNQIRFGLVQFELKLEK